MYLNVLDTLYVNITLNEDHIITLKMHHNSELRVKSGVGNGNPFQYSCLENSMDRGAWRAEVHGVSKNWTQLNY